MVKKKILRKKKPIQKLPTRITNDTVAEHRERVLAGGRKLKYPLQYTRAKLIRNTIIISLAALVALIILVWAQLYVWKDTSDLAYRITRVIPLPVAKIDGEFVRYSDYLLYHRNTMAVLESQDRNDSGLASDRMQFQQKQSIDRALENAYVQKIAREKNISVSDQQTDELIEQQRKDSKLSESAYAAVVSDHLHWTMEELHQAMKSTLLRKEVAFSVDAPAAKTAQSVNNLTKQGSSLEEIAQQLGKAVEYQSDIVVPKDNSDGGLSQAAEKLEVGKTSGAVKTLAGDGYYFITRNSSSGEQVAYSFIKVPLTVFDTDFNRLLDSDKTKVYISIK